MIHFEPTPGGAREILKFTTAVHSTDFSPLHNCLVFAVTDGGKLHLRIVSKIKLPFSALEFNTLSMKEI